LSPSAAMNPSPTHHGTDLRARKFYPPPLPPPCIGGYVPCLRCGYNLKTLQVHWRCPECGVLVNRSLARLVASRRHPSRWRPLPWVITVIAFVLLASVDASEPLYPVAVIFFAGSLFAAGKRVLDRIGRSIPD